MFGKKPPKEIIRRETNINVDDLNNALINSL
jgi:hypothetical protein